MKSTVFQVKSALCKKMTFGAIAKYRSFVYIQKTKQGIVNEVKLTSNANLTRGLTVMRRNSLSTQYVMYSDVDVQGMGRVTRKVVLQVYRKELMKIWKVGEFMGIWQFHQAW